MNLKNHLCQTHRERWEAAFDRETTPPSSAATHFQRCAECRAWSESLLATRALLRDWPLPPENEAADLAALTTLRTSPAARLETLQRPLWQPVLAGGGAFAATLALAGGLLNRATMPVAPPQPHLNNSAGALMDPSQIDAWVNNPTALPRRTLRPAPRPLTPPGLRGDRRGHRNRRDLA